MSNGEQQMDPFIYYLLSAKASIQCIERYKDIHIVLCNESCDLDSSACALVYAFYLKQSIYKDKTVLVLPVLNVVAEEFPLRTEVCYVLEEAGIGQDTVIFKDEIHLKNLQTTVTLKVTLVDHHMLAEEDEFLKDNVVSIFDHRPIESNFCKPENVKQMRIVQVGSCSTLIAEEITQKNRNILCEKAALLLYNAIIFDTIALKPENGRATELDICIAEGLEKNFDLPEDRQKLFNYLWRVHMDTDQLTSSQLLMRDLKIVEAIPVASLPMLVHDFLKLEDASNALAEFAQQKRTNLVVLAGLEASDVVRRDLAVYFRNEDDELLGLLLEEFKNGDTGDHNKLEVLEVEVDTTNVVYFKQNNIKATRKHIIPLLKTAMSKYTQNRAN